MLYCIISYYIIVVGLLGARPVLRLEVPHPGPEVLLEVHEALLRPHK